MLFSSYWLTLIMQVAVFVILCMFYVYPYLFLLHFSG